jgi:hypothetical protein
MAIKGKEDVVLVVPGEVDHHGDPVGGDTQAAIFTQCVVWPRVSTEVEREGTVITEGYNVWIPYGPNAATLFAAEEITGDDRVIVRGDEWRITGTPADQRTMKSKRLGLQMVVGRIA